jgi:hypothetical protein
MIKIKKKPLTSYHLNPWCGAIHEFEESVLHFAKKEFILQKILVLIVYS